jgi:ribosomal protein S12 methylthiotransferase accessory factor
MARVDPANNLQLLLQKHGGLFDAASVSLTNCDEPQMTVRSANLGDVGALWPELRKRGTVAASIRAGGCGLDEASALIPALAEGLERYCTSVFRNEQFIWATANELGADALSPSRSPMGS